MVDFTRVKLDWSEKSCLVTSHAAKREIASCEIVSIAVREIESNHRKSTMKHRKDGARPLFSQIGFFLMIQEVQL